MARIMEAEARISAIDATGATFERIAQKVRGLSGAMKSFGTAAQNFSGGVNRHIGRVSRFANSIAPVAGGAAAFETMRGVHDLIHDTAQAAAARLHERARMEVSGMSESEISDAERVSQDLSERYKALSTTTIMHALRNMRAIVGTYDEAGKILDPILKLRISAMGAHPERASELEGDFDALVKGMEIKGVTMDPVKFRSYMEGMAKAINVFGDTLNPTDYYEMFKFGRQATQNLSEQFMLETAPTLAQEMRGMSAGRAMSSFYQAIVGGRIKEQSVKEMAALGLIDPSRVQRTKTGSIKGLLPGGVKDWQLAASDPYAWTNDVLLPALKAHGITDPKAIQSVIGTIFQQATAGQMVGIFATQQARIHKDWNLVHGAKGLEGADVFMSKDPFIAMQGVTEQLHNLLAIAGGPLAEPAAAALNKLAGGIVALENAATAHPKVAATVLGSTAAGLIGAAGAASLWALKGIYGIGRRVAGAGEAAVDDLSGSAAIRAMQAALPSAAAGPSLMGTVAASAMRYGLGPLGMLLGSTTEANVGESPGLYPHYTTKDIAGALGMPAPEIGGRLGVDVKVDVAPSEDFVSRVVTGVANLLGIGPSGGGGGTAGSTGVSMPEAIPNP